MLHGLVEMFLTLHKNALLILIQHGLNDIGHLSSELLRAWLSRHQNHSEAIYVANILQFPLHHGFSRFMDKTIFLSGLKANNEWTCLEELAKINISIVSFMNQNEIIEVSKFLNLKCYFSYLIVRTTDA
jgi:(3S)-linalool synthase